MTDRLDDSPQPGSPSSPAEEPSTLNAEPTKPPYVIEGARSARARCKSCRKKIEKGALRLGILVVGPFGPGYMWHHLNCAAGRQYDRLEEAYELEAWKNATDPVKVPTLESLKQLQEKASERRANRKRPPYAERAPSGRSSCKHCGEIIEKNAWRVVLGREVEFGSQVRTAPINVLPAHVPDVLDEPDCTSNADDFAAALKANSGLDEPDLTEVLGAIGPMQ